MTNFQNKVLEKVGPDSERKQRGPLTGGWMHLHLKQDGRRRLWAQWKVCGRGLGWRKLRAKL